MRLATGLLITWIAFGQVPQENTKLPTEPNKPVPAHEMTAADIEAFLDGLMPLQLGENDLGGAVITIVKDGNVIFEKGYGFSDVVKKTPVSPNATLFRIGSISKLFTWTAVMQLVEEGKINLDADVNNYLDFKIPATYPQPITVRNLMTHTTGFNEAVKDLIDDNPKNLPSLGDFLKKHIPVRIFPPGKIPAYSNYGASLAGYIVERVSGQPFNDYVEQHIFQPLKMQRTTFRQPLPAALKPLMSSGYQLASQPAKPFEIVVPFPAGSVAASGDDMTHFMMAHLQSGSYQGAQILRPETVQMMHSRQFAYDPRMNGMCLGFYEETRNGHRIVGHGGDTDYFHSDLHLIQDLNLGFFVSYNSAGKGQISPRDDLWTSFLDRYLPYTPPQSAPPAHPQQDAKEVSGSYLSTRRTQGNVLSFLMLTSEPKVTANSDGTISVDAVKSLAGQPKHFREVAPMLFRETDGQAKLSFTRDGSGHLVMDLGYPFFVFQRTPLLLGAALNLTILIYCLAVFVLVLLLWPIAALVRWHYGRKLAVPPGTNALRLLVRIVCFINVLFALCWISLLQGFSNGSFPTSATDPQIRIFQIIGWLGVIGAILVIFATVRFVRQPGGWWFKTYNVALAIACIGYVWFMFNWHLLSLSLTY